MSLSQALKLGKVELSGINGTQPKLRRLGQIVRLFASEVAGTLQLAPFGLKASTLYSKLQPPPDSAISSSSDDDVYLVKSIYYGTRPRNTVDLYLPKKAQRQQQQHQGLPVVLFVHGGVWAAGEAWHYAPLATSLARLGVITCVMQYTLYPDALVPQLVQEVAAAFDWALENVGSYGGDARKVSLVGHSAGAQLCMMALMQRAQAAHAAAAAAAANGAGQPGHTAEQQSNQQQLQQQQLEQQKEHLQMPQQFVGVTGVYDIAKHYAYEKDRGVHSLSTMLPAMGGFQQFAANSPSVVLAAALQQLDTQSAAPAQLQGQSLQQQHPQQQQQQQRQQGHEQQQAAINGASSQQQQQQQQRLEEQELPACNFYNGFPLSGESIAHRIGFDRGSDHYKSAEAGLTLQSLSGMTGVPHFPLEAAAHLPPTVLLSSCTDLTVPWYESAELYWRLFDCGVPVKHLVYNKVGHGEFVTEWPANFSSGQAAADASSSGGKGSTLQGSSSSQQHQQHAVWLQELPAHCRDLASVVMGQTPVNFVHKSKVTADAISSTRRKSSNGNGVQPGHHLEGVVSKVDAPTEWN